MDLKDLPDMDWNNDLEDETGVPEWLSTPEQAERYVSSLEAFQRAGFTLAEAFSMVDEMIAHKPQSFKKSHASAEALTDLPVAGCYVSALEALQAAGYPAKEAFEMLDDSIRNKTVAAKEIILYKIASYFDQIGELRAAHAIDTLIEKQAKERTGFIFGPKHPKVKDDKGHFPLGNGVAQARSALAEASKYSAAPKWYSGTLKELVSTVSRAVHRKFPSIQITERSKKPGKN